MISFNGVQEPVEAAVWYALNNYCYDDAIFIAERLHAEVCSPNTVFLLATCYYRSSRLQQAKFLLSKERHSTLNHSQCILLYAQCCLDLKEYKEGLLALNGLLNLHDGSETDLHAVFGQDAGVAFLLLGKIKYRLQQKEDAARFFQSALRHNPFLWSAFVSLFEMEEDGVMGACNVKEYFKVSEYPSFLRPRTASLPISTTQAFTTQSKTVGAGAATVATEQKQDDLNLICAELPPLHLTAKVLPNSTHYHASAFKPVVAGLAAKIKNVYMTPDIFHGSSMGVAMASSTPTTKAPKNLSARNRLPSLGVWSESGCGNKQWTQVAMDSVRATLDFGSTSSKCSVRTTSPTVTPLHPSFGVLPMACDGGSGCGSKASCPQHVLDFSCSTVITPSPQPLPPDYIMQLMSAPKSTIRRNKVPIQQLPDTLGSNFRSGTESRSQKLPSSLPMELSVESSESDMPHPLSKTTAAPLGAGPGVFHDRMMCLEQGLALPISEARDAPPKSAVSLRRSIRLSASGRRLGDHSIHAMRAKSRLKSPTSTRRALDANIKTTIKGVSFNPAIRGRTSSLISSSSSSSPSASSSHPSSSSKHINKSQPASGSSSMGVALGENVPHLSSSNVAPNILATNQNRENLRSAGSNTPREGVVNELRESEADKKENIVGVAEMEGPGKSFQEVMVAQQQALEQAAMAGLTALMQLLVHLADAYRALMVYDLGGAVSLFQGLPPHHWDTPWTLTQVAHAYFSAERFKKAAHLYRLVHEMDPHRQEGMDLYSSCLWHLQREVELSVLAHTLHSSNKLLPQGLCAMASLKNLHKDHDAAISFLTQATLVCPEHAYAHTLLGHEHWLVKDYERALSSFQHASALQPRHYNAWYGMAHVSFAQEKYSASEVYAAKVLSINGCSSIACTQMGLAQLRQSKHHKALEAFDRALAINPYNPIPRFHKAKVLEAMQLFEESLKELDILAKSWPKEPNLYISKGKILKKLNRNHEASLQFSWALDFSRSGSSSQLREEIDQAYHNQNSLDPGANDAGADFLPLDDPSIEGDEESLEAGESDDGSMRSD